jgi:hypothetical protein
VRYDDRTWFELWDRTLDQIERRRIATAALKREIPEDRLGRRLVPELARRWRRSARNQALFHLWWVLFWGSIMVAADGGGSPAGTLARNMALFSGAIILLCVEFRRYLFPITRSN